VPTVAPTIIIRPEFVLLDDGPLDGPVIIERADGGTMVAAVGAPQQAAALLCEACRVLFAVAAADLHEKQRRNAASSRVVNGISGSVTR
jgi:hypothetical protein